MRTLDELQYADTLGYDGICVNEHHQNAYGLMPSPNVIGGMLARRTKNAKIAILGAGPGNATHGQTLKHMTLFQNEVMPAFKKYHE